MSDHSPHFSKSLKIEEAKWDSLPPEIQIEIVVRLPFKSIITWTSVSKSWNSLIKNPKFISNHLNRTIHSYNPLLLLSKFVKSKDEKEVYSLRWDNETFDEYTRFDFPFHALRPNIVFRVVGTCNGLVCLAHKYHYNNFFVWNPCIRKYVTLPTPNVTSRTPDVHMFDACIGFGFDSKTNDYKVVTVVTLLDKGDWKAYPPKFDVYSLATGKWKMVTAVPPTCVVPEQDQQAFVNGALHWPVRRSTNDGYRNFILAFDLGAEDFHEIMLPKDLLNVNSLFGLSVLVCGESLALSRRVHGDDPNIHLWVMKEYGLLESWTKVSTVELPRDLYFLHDQEDDLNALGFRKSGEVVIVTEDGKLVSIGYESKNITDLRIPGYGFTSAQPYVESLVLLNKSEDAVSY